MAADSLKGYALETVAWILVRADYCSPVGVSRPRPRRSSNGRTVYKWVDAQGVTHYGDQVPPEYAAQEQQIINAQGVVISRREPKRPPSRWLPKNKRRLDVPQRARTGITIC